MGLVAATMRRRRLGAWLLAAVLSMAGVRSAAAIDDTQSPVGPTVNRELGLWDTYQQAVLVTGAVLIGQLLLIGGLLVQRRRRQQSEGRTRAILGAMPDPCSFRRRTGSI